MQHTERLSGRRNVTLLWLREIYDLMCGSLTIRHERAPSSGAVKGHIWSVSEGYGSVSARQYSGCVERSFPSTCGATILSATRRRMGGSSNA